jgi:hypothetical protein
MDWIELAQDRDQWRALVNTVTSLKIPGGLSEGTKKHPIDDSR